MAPATVRRLPNKARAYLRASMSSRMPMTLAVEFIAQNPV
jgi:hypothetical protein